MLVLGKFRAVKDVFVRNFLGLNIFCTPRVMYRFFTRTYLNIEHVIIYCLHKTLGNHQKFWCIIKLGNIILYFENNHIHTYIHCSGQSKVWKYYYFFFSLKYLIMPWNFDVLVKYVGLFHALNIVNVCIMYRFVLAISKVWM